MGNSFTKDINKAFGKSSMGGEGAGAEPDDWNPEQRDPDYNPQPDKPPPPTVPKFTPPPFYSPRQSQLQKTTYNPQSTSHAYLQRFGASSNY